MAIVSILMMLSGTAFCHLTPGADSKADGPMIQAKVYAANQIERTKVAENFAIDLVRPEYVVITTSEQNRPVLENLGLRFEVLRSRPFPNADQAFHDYPETMMEIDKLANAYPDLVKKISIGKSLQGRDLSGVRISASQLSDSLPTAIFLGCHHAREHLSVEVPLILAQYLAKNYAVDSRIKRLLDTREVWIVPVINPDGAEYDIASGSYRYWRKNRKNNGDGTFGVDLNRNYGAFFGGPGASSSTSSDTYKGVAAFSEPETAAVRDFVRARKQATVLISFHTFSELILWPWGHTDDLIANDTDRAVFETMGKKMAEWNQYTPQKSSELYLASGDTTDWAYDELKLFAFTFELSPSSLGGGGFYPGAAAIEPTFKANIEPALYLIDKAQDPVSVLGRSQIDPLGIL